MFLPEKLCTSRYVSISHVKNVKCHKHKLEQEMCMQGNVRPNELLLGFFSEISKNLFFRGTYDIVFFLHVLFVY